MARRNKNKDGDETLGNQAKGYRFNKRKTPTDIPFFRVLVKSVWESIILFSQKDKLLSLELIQRACNKRPEYLELVLTALEAAGRIKVDRENKTIEVIYK